MKQTFERGFLVTMFLPFGAIHEENLRRTLETMSSLEFFRPKFVGIDERKRVPYDLDKAVAMSRQQASRPPLGKRPLYLWHRAMDREPSWIHLKDEAPSTLDMVFVGKDAVDNGQQIVEEFSQMVDVLRPKYAEIAMRAHMAELIADRPDLLEHMEANPPPSTVSEIYYAGLGSFSTATWLDAELVEILGPAVLAELGARQTARGDWYIEVKEEPWTATPLQIAEFAKHTAEILRKHGQLGRSMHPKIGPIYTAPNWRRPASWLSAADPRVERLIAGVNA